MRARGWLAVILLAATILVPVASEADVAPYSATRGTIGALPLGIGETVAQTAAPALDVAGGGLRPAARGIRIALISSGVDATVLPEARRAQVSLLGNWADPVGYGTAAASVLLALAPDARLTSIGVYPGGRFNADWQAAALNYIAARPHDYDVVLYAIPGTDFLDPVSAAMATREWEPMMDALGDRGVRGARGPVFGSPLAPGLRAAQTQGLPYAERAAIERFAYVNARWAQARGLIQKITAAGVSVVAPAGDYGSNLQTVFGLANLAEVQTVGAYDGTAVSRSSSSGPSLDGLVKPDLVAPTGIVTLLPPSSSLSKAFGAAGMLDPALKQEWGSGVPSAAVAARPDSSFTAAAVVAAAMGGLAAQGMRDTNRQRGALMAASLPLEGVPVWRQGAGVLQFVPDAAWAGSRPLALSNANLGLEPESGSWAATVPIAGGAATDITSGPAGFAGVGPDGRNTTVAAGAAQEPPISAHVSDRGVELTLPLGDYSYRGGLYCTYEDVSVPVTGGSVRPGVDVHGLPLDMEQVPACLVKGTRLEALNFYIHDMPAEDLTIGLLPALPPGASLLDHAMTFLPVDPLSTRLFFRVSGPTEVDAQGRPYNAVFPNVPPGYYTVRQWSDYGAPVTQTTTDSVTGLPVTSSTDIGENPSYQSFKALILSPLCSSPLSEGAASGADLEEMYSSPCSEQWLKDHFGPDNVSRDKPTGGYMVRAGSVTVRVIFDWMKKMPGAGVASRYIDLLKYEDLSFNVLDAVDIRLPQLAQAATADLLKAWKLERASDATGVAATFNPLAAASNAGRLLGIARYPFNLTTPNYKAHMSLNFSYETTNTYMLVVVQMGEDVAWGVVTPKGTFRLPSTSASMPLSLPNIDLSGHGTGRANFEFHMLPRGASRGTIYFVFVPSPMAGQLVAPLAASTLTEISFELDTWTNTLWPAARFNLPGGVVDGHSFGFNSRYSAAQMSDPCRVVDSGRNKAQVCEDWIVAVHSPGDDAATFDVRDSAGASLGAELASAGGTFFDPRRGVADFTFRLAHAFPSVLDVERLFGQFRTNGRFWEQMSIPRAFLQQHPGPVEVAIADNEPGRSSTMLGHVPGPVRVAPYVPFRSSAAFLSP